MWAHTSWEENGVWRDKGYETERGETVKIVRVRERGGRISWGSIGKDGTQIYRIEGDIYGEWGVSGERIDGEEMLAPVEPPNIIALGLNYKKHADETGIVYPEIPVMFIKGTNSITGDGMPIVLPAAGGDNVDYEAELAIIIGRTAKNVSAEEAKTVILGYTCANDVSARDWQKEKQKKQWARGKSFDTFCPVGPWVVTADEIGDPDNLRITCRVNGRIMQDARTSDMCFNVDTIVSDLSRSMTLLPGTLILTGTPEGVGFTRNPPVYLRDGDVVAVEIEDIGVLTNHVERER